MWVAGLLLSCALAALSQPPTPSRRQQPAATAPALEAASLSRLRLQALDHFYNLEYTPALSDFRRLAQADPQSAAAWNHVAQVELYQEMYRIGALQIQLYGHSNAFFDQRLKAPDPSAVQSFLTDNQKAMDLATEAAARAPADAHAYYDLAVAWGLRGTFDFALRRSYWDALGDAKKARHQAETARQLDPAFLDPELILGVHNYVAGSLPWSARLFSALMGYHGNKELGRRQIAAVADHDGNARIDASVLLALIDRRDGLNRQAVQQLTALSANYPRNVLFAVETAEAEEAAGEHGAARRQYETVVQRAREHKPGYREAPLARVWYGLGNIDALFSRWPQAAHDFEQVLQLPHAPLPYVQAAALSAGQMEERAGRWSAARHDYQVCIGADVGSDTAAKASRRLERLSQRAGATGQSAGAAAR